MSKYHKGLTKNQIKLIEKLADIEHTRWACWQRYMFNKCELQDSGRGVGKPYNLVIPSKLVEHWAQQINTDYKNLTEQEKDSDREQVMRYWSLINK